MNNDHEYESKIIAYEEELKINYGAELSAIKLEISSLKSKNQQLERINEYIRQWSSEIWKLLSPDDFSNPVPNGTTRAHLFEARKKNKTYYWFLDELRKLLFSIESESVSIAKPANSKIIWTGTQVELVKFIMRAINGFFNKNDRSLYRYIANHFTSSETGDYTPAQLKDSYNKQKDEYPTNERMEKMDNVFDDKKGT